MGSHAGTFAAIVATIVALASPLPAQTIDQQNPIVDRAVGLDYFPGWAVQSFRPTSSTAAGAGIFLENWFQPGSLTGVLDAGLWEGLPGTAGSVLLANGVTPFATGQAGGGWFDVFWPAVGVTPGQQYFLAFSGYDNQGTVIPTFTWHGEYPDGQLYFSDGLLGPIGAYYSDLPLYDINFREYSTSAVVSTPEPASLVLIATGLLGLLGVARRKRAM